MTLLVRDEEDIIKSNIDFHLSQGVDFIIAMDNLSEDATKDILKAYEAKGVLKYIHESDDNYNQHRWVTRMARMAYSEYGADWVINNDADEFWYSENYGSLKEALVDMSNKGYNIVEAKRCNFVYIGDDKEGNFYDYMIYREKVSFNPLGQPLPPKQAHIGSKDIVVHQGNHSVEGIEKQKINYNAIKIFHFPIRTQKQLINKIAKGGSAYENNQELSDSIGRTWRELYKTLNNSGHLDNYLADNLYDQDKLNKSLESNKIIIDKTIQEYMYRVTQ